MTVYYIALGFFALIGIACVLSYAAVATLVYIERRNARHDAEDAEVFGPRIAYPLPSPDAPDEVFERWVAQAISHANDRSYDRTLAEIRALPERKTA